MHVLCVTCVFFACIVYFASNPLSESCNINLNFAANDRHQEVCLELL